MRSSRPSDAAPPAAGIDFDPEGLLGHAPGVLFDPRFTGSLHVDLEGEFGRAEAARTLAQMGCLRGLRDAAAVVEAGLGEGDAGAIPAAAELPIRLVWNPRPSRRGAVELHGAWPEQAEAVARLERLGPGTGPSCWLSAGYTSGWLSGLLGIDLIAFETSCCARGDAECTFLGREVEVWRAEGPEAARALLEALPFPALRDLAARHGGPAPEAPRGIDSSQPVVHIWGPVMVIPFAGADEAQLAVELIGRDPGAAGVSVVVVDLTGAIIDEAFGAAALERILEKIESWGAEAVFAGISSLSEPAVAGLERQPLMLAKDLHGGIAAGFQIASAQRRMV